jgi:GT2 family glycosyltransferase
VSVEAEAGDPVPGAEPQLAASDFAVVIPTQNRWAVLEPTIDGLRRQTVQGFTLVVIVDHDAVLPGFLADTQVVERKQRGVAAARNAGLAATDRRIVLFLGDDTIPDVDLVVRHLSVHRRYLDARVGVLGSVHWHPEVARGRLQRWLDWSGTQFEYHTIEGDEAGWGRLYSSNVSLKRELLQAVGGFDEEFVFGYEDTELGMRLDRAGLRLLYEPGAKVWHLHRYDWPAIERRFLLVGGGEYLMVRKHPEFTPHFLEKLTWHRRVGPLSLWPRIVDRVPRRAGRFRRGAELRADAWYSKQLAPAFMAGWLAAQELDELGEDQTAVLYEAAAAERLAELRCLGELLPLLSPGCRLLAAGCSATAALALAAAGYRLTFVAESPRQQRTVETRLEGRGLEADVPVSEDLEAMAEAGRFEGAVCFHPERLPAGGAALEAAERTASMVAALFESAPTWGEPARRRNLVHRRYADGSELRVYRPDGRRGLPHWPGRRRTVMEVAKAHAGRRLGRRAWLPPASLAAPSGAKSSTEGQPA